jgi:ElaB/YqjD/DUF883 family membrane-anchored ribosome-binding protein
MPHPLNELRRIRHATTFCADKGAATGVTAMGREYQQAHLDEPYDLSDPAGIASEIGQEAVADAKDLANETADRIAETACATAEGVSRTASAAYEHPGAFAEYSIRATKRFVRDNPFKALLITGGVAFIFGALTQIGRHKPSGARYAR